MSQEEIDFLKHYGTVEDRQAARRIESRKFHSQHNEMILNSRREIICKYCDTVECVLTEQEYNDWIQFESDIAKLRKARKKIQPTTRYNHNTGTLETLIDGETQEQFEKRIAEITKW